MEAPKDLIECLASSQGLCGMRVTATVVHLSISPHTDLALQPPGASTGMLDDNFLEICLQGVAGPQLASCPSPPACPDLLECTHTLALDDPFLTEFTDLHSLLDSVGPVVDISITPSPLSAMDEVYELSDGLLGLETPSPSSELPSSLPSPLPGILSSDPASPSSSLSSETSSRKRSRDDESLPDHKVACEGKQTERRLKNNVASQISRAKRRARNQSLFQREKDLREENAHLRVRVDEMTREAQRLRTLLVTKLSH